MKYFGKLFYIAVTGIYCLLPACNKKKNDPTPVTNSYQVIEVCPENKNYFPLTKGSYWIYENSNYNSTNNTRIIINNDSCYIANRDSMINGIPYAIMCTVSTTYQPTPSTSYALYRYSGNYVELATYINSFSYCETNKILHSSKDISGIWHSTLAALNKDTLISTPAGDFESRVIENKHTLDSAYINSGLPNYWYSYQYYGKGIGVIYRLTPYTSNPNVVFESRLVRYHIE